MNIDGKAHCLFEQSGTFKNEFKKLGIPAEDYDIQDNFGETDHVVDLFHEIEEGFEDRPSIFDSMKPDDLIMAFFPCIRFCEIAEYNQRSAQEQWRRNGMPVKRIWELLKKQSDERFYFYQVCLKMHALVECRGLRMIMENPWNVQNFTNLFWFMKPSVIDTDRTRRGDWFMKPTAFWYTNCKPTHGFTFQPLPKSQRRSADIGYWSKRPNPHDKSQRAKGSAQSGLCSEERSMISPDYARNFICDFVLGITQKDTRQLELFTEEDYA